MAGALSRLSRRAFIGRTLTAMGAAGLLPPSLARSRVPGEAELRFHVTTLPKSSVATRLAQLRSSRSAISQLVLEGEQGCLILVGVQGTSGARRLEL